jgi:structural maintenance of chromosome 4
LAETSRGARAGLYRVSRHVQGPTDISEDDEDEVEGESEVVQPEPAPEADDAEDREEAETTAQTTPKRKQARNDTTELVEYSPDELRSVDKNLLTAEITQLEEDISKARPNLTILNEFRKREAEFLERAKDLDAVNAQRDAAKQRYDDLRKVRLDEFMAGFSAISAKLKEMYQVRRPLKSKTDN